MKLRLKISKYHLWYLYQISPQIMLLPILIAPAWGCLPSSQGKFSLLAYCYNFLFPKQFFFCDLWSMHYWWRKTSKETENAYIFKRRDDDTHSFVLGMSTAVCKFERFSRNEKPLQPLYPIKFHICLRWLDPVFWEGTILLWSSVVSVPLLLS